MQDAVDRDLVYGENGVTGAVRQVLTRHQPHELAHPVQVGRPELEPTDLAPRPARRPCHELIVPLHVDPWDGSTPGCHHGPMQPRGGTQGTAERPSADAARMAALARIGAQLAAATDLEGLTEVITDRAASVIGASAAVLAMRDGPDRMRTIGSHGLSPTLVRRWATFPLAVPSPLSDAVRSGCTVTLSGRVEMAERYPDLDDGIDRSSVSLPLLDPGTGRAVGAVGFRFDSRHEPLDPGGLSILTVLTDMCAQTMLRLQAETQSADRAARLEFLAHASEALAASLDYRQTLGQVASLAVPTHADWCSVQMVDDGVLRTLAVAHADPTKVQLARELETRWPPDPKARSGAAEVARTGRSLLVEEVTDEMLVAAARDEEHLQLARELGLRSAMSVPLDAHGQVLGVLTLVGAESGRRYTRADLSFAEDLARRAALAIDNADLYSQTRRTAAVLKATLLPQEMPEVEGWLRGTVYRQAGRTDVGGDFYDVSDLGGGRVSAVLGDVMGRGSTPPWPARGCARPPGCWRPGPRPLGPRRGDGPPHDGGAADPARNRRLSHVRAGAGLALHGRRRPSAAPAAAQRGAVPVRHRGLTGARSRARAPPLDADPLLPGRPAPRLHRRPRRASR